VRPVTAVLTVDRSVRVKSGDPLGAAAALDRWGVFNWARNIQPSIAADHFAQLARYLIIGQRLEWFLYWLRRRKFTTAKCMEKLKMQDFTAEHGVVDLLGRTIHEDLAGVLSISIFW
jgi:hypothetical protein